MEFRETGHSAISDELKCLWRSGLDFFLRGNYALKVVMITSVAVHIAAVNAFAGCPNATTYVVPFDTSYSRLSPHLVTPGHVLIGDAGRTISSIDELHLLVSTIASATGNVLHGKIELSDQIHIPEGGARQATCRLIYAAIG